MGAMSEVVGLDCAEEFFAPVAADMVDGLVGQYCATRKRIEAVAAFVEDEINGGVIHYFLDGNCDPNNGRMSMKRSASQLFDPTGAVAALNSAYWSKAMQMTDVLDFMPQKRRDEWNKSITEQTCPEFTEETVRSTLTGLLNMRSQFLAERVDGIFRGLSGEHVTNSPAAFGKRMIVGYVLNEYHHENHGKCGLINDLRCVIAKFMGRDEPKYYASSALIQALKGRWGEWVEVDGGSLKIRLYKKGTAHIEVHPDMAWRLNLVLAHLYPMAIPPEFRTKPKRKAKEVRLIQRPLPFAVVELLAQMRQAYRMVKQDNWRNPYRKDYIQNAVEFDTGYNWEKTSKHAKDEAEKVLESIGGVKAKEGWFQFGYNPGEVLNEIIASGCIPDQKAHQFYPTPENVAAAAIELAEIGPDHFCLEPSAGTGGLADHMPKTQTHCIEVSKLRCDVLAAKGYDVTQADFLEWATKTTDRFDRIVMNPPFDQGRWKAHLEAAASLLKPGGRLVAILPVSAKGKDLLPGHICSFPETFDNAFAGTSVSVTIACVQQP
jgi:hypothetical protein